MYSGTLKRHARTAELAGFAQFDARHEFNEYDADDILGTGRRDRSKIIASCRNVFNEMVPQWIRGPWKHLRWKHGGLLTSASSAGCAGFWKRAVPAAAIVVFTSGGPIGVAVQTVVGAKEPMAMELNWRIRNCSLTEFIFTRTRVSLDGFNATPHLSEVTFR